jgi:hypothetical protein
MNSSSNISSKSKAKKKRKNRPNVVVSRYNRNVDFVNRFHSVTPVNILIYDKETPSNPLNIPVNKGNEASVYLKYIIDYYDKLPQYTFFIQDEEFAWHHSGSIVDKFREAVDAKQKYYNINDLAHWNKPNMIEHPLYQVFLMWYSGYIEEYIPLAKVPNNKDLIYDHRGAAQFLVHRDLIRGLPKQFYERLYNWIITTELHSHFSGRFLEWTWHVFWLIYPKINAR